MKINCSKRKSVTFFVYKWANVTFLLLGLIPLAARAQAPGFRWAIQPVGSGGGSGNAIAADAAGNIFVSGYFTPPGAAFGPIALTNSAASDTFLVKYDVSGNVIWAQQTRATGFFNSRGVVLDGQGNIYLTGYFGVGNATFGSSVLTNAGGTHCFTAKYDSSGSALWAVQSSGNGFEFGKGIAADPAGNVYVAGTYTTFGRNIFDPSQSSPLGNDIFIAKYGSDGTLLWARQAGGNVDEDIGGIGLDASGNCYVLGTFGSSSLVFGSTTLTHFGSENIFLVKYDPAGNALWARLAGGTRLGQRPRR